MNTQSDTPRTDAAVIDYKTAGILSNEFVRPDFARTLERELNAANERIKRLEWALEWTLGMKPSPCRCMSFATPPHVCIAHKALAK